LAGHAALVVFFAQVGQGISPVDRQTGSPMVVVPPQTGHFPRSAESLPTLSMSSSRGNRPKATPDNAARRATICPPLAHFNRTLNPTMVVAIRHEKREQSHEREMPD
jgi:hypothetical protein